MMQTDRQREGQTRMRRCAVEWWSALHWSVMASSVSALLQSLSEASLHTGYQSAAAAAAAGGESSELVSLASCHQHSQHS